MPNADAAAALVIIPDCNVLIHGKALRELPWQDLGTDEIEVLIIGPVLREVDALKTRPGRPGRLARDISSDLRKLLQEPGQSDVIRDQGPRVTRRLWLGDEARAPARDGIDVTHGDLAIINRGIWMMDRGRQVLLLTDDTLAAAHAMEFGLPFRLLDDSWLRAPEADEAQKEVARLKAEITRLKASEPTLRGWFRDANGVVIEWVEANLRRYEPIDATLIDGLVERVLAANPVAPSPPIPPARKTARKGPVDITSIDAEMDRQFSPILARAYEKYRADYEAWTKDVRRSLTDLHVTWNRRQDWPEIVFMAVNEGTKPAEAALVELVVEGDFTIERPQKWEGEAKRLDGKRRTSELEIPMPPVPPVRQTAASLLFGDNSHLLMGDSVRSFDALSGLSRTRDADAFYWRTGRGKPTTRIELDCANWRHAREEEDFPFVIRGKDEGQIRGIVIGRLSAGNVVTPVEARLPVRISFETRAAEPIAEIMVAEFERVSVSWRRAQKLAAVSP